MKKTFFTLLAVVLSLLTCVSCSGETLDYNNLDVDLFTRQLKAGDYNTKSPEGFVEMSKFTEKDIPALLNYTGDLAQATSFPLPPVSTYYSGKVRLGERMLWIVKTIRLGHYALFSCRMVGTNAENYEGICFLTGKELLDAAARYCRWWGNRQYPRTAWTIDACSDEPLYGSGYRWWQETKSDKTYRLSGAVFRGGSDPLCPMNSHVKEFKDRSMRSRYSHLIE